MWGASFKMIKRKIGATCGTTLLVATAVVVALRERRQPLPSPDVPVAQTSAEVRVKAVERKMEPVAEGEVAAASGAVAIVCGEDPATADRYEARNDALRSIARRRDLPEGDIAALMDYLASTNDVLRVERIGIRVYISCTVYACSGTLACYPQGGSMSSWSWRRLHPTSRVP